MNENILNKNADFSYDIVMYREVVKNVLIGLKKLLRYGSLPLCYKPYFRKGADIYRMRLLATGYYDYDEDCTAEMIELAGLTTKYLSDVAIRHEDFSVGNHSPKVIHDIIHTLLDFAEGSPEVDEYSEEHIEGIYTLFSEFWWVLEKEGMETGLWVSSCSICTEETFVRQTN